MGAHGYFTQVVPADLIYIGFLIVVWVIAVIFTLFGFMLAWSSFTSKFRPQIEVSDEQYTGKEEWHQKIWQVSDMDNMYQWWYY
jgi:hypothetical protein